MAAGLLPVGSREGYPGLRLRVFYSMSDFRAEAMHKAGIVPIAFDPRQQVPGLDGCTGIARLGLCIRCDRLYQSGKQIPVAAVRGTNGTYECANQVVGGVHVTTMRPAIEGQHP